MIVVSDLGLPSPPTPFVGRNAELIQIRQWLADPTFRLISLVGLGGTGKTRLAIEAASQNVNQFPDGVFFVRLQPLELPELILPAIAEAAHLALLPGIGLQRQLVEFLGEKRRLFVLDGIEQVLSGVDAVIDLLQFAPEVKFLTTSREKLNLLDETVLHVGPLKYPEQEMADNAEQYDAVAMFLGLLRRVEPDLLITRGALAETCLICRQLQGMPLAIELAVGWADTLSLAEIAQEIAHGLDILETRMRAFPDRHRNIRVVLDSSLQTLSDTDRAVLESLCLFRSSFTREAAGAVAGATLQSLARLVDKSLVRHRSSGRYEIHELVRQYGEARLKSVPGHWEAAQDRYCTYYSGFLEARWREMKVAMPAASFERIDAEFLNCMIAFQSMVENGHSAQIWQAMDALWTYCAIRLRLSEGILLFRQSIEAFRARGDDDALTGSLLLRQSTLQACLNSLGEVDEAKRLADTGLMMLERHQHRVSPHTRMMGYLCSVFVYWYLDNPQQMKEAAQKSLDCSTQNHDSYGVRNSMCFLASAEFRLGNLVQAKEMGQATYDLARRDGDVWVQTIATLDVLARTAYVQKEYEEARSWCQAGLRCLEDLPNPFALALAQLLAVGCAIALRDFEEARKHFNDCLQLCEESGLVWQIPATMLGVAGLLTEHHMPEHAVEVLPLVFQHRACRETTRAEATGLLDLLKSALPADRFAAAWARGQARQPGQALDDLVAVQPVDRSGPASYSGDLSERELEVLRLMADGLSNTEIAERLCLSLGTVKVHTRHVYDKLGVNNRTHAVTSAQKQGIL